MFSWTPSIGASVASISQQRTTLSASTKSCQKESLSMVPAVSSGNINFNFHNPQDCDAPAYIEDAFKKPQTKPTTLEEDSTEMKTLFPPQRMISHEVPEEDEEIKNKGSAVCNHVDSLVGTLQGLHKDTAKWKKKYMAAKKDHYQKFFTESHSALSSSCFKEWRSQAVESALRKQASRLERKLRNNMDEYPAKLEVVRKNMEDEAIQKQQEYEEIRRQFQEKIDMAHQDCKDAAREKKRAELNLAEKRKILDSTRKQLDPITSKSDTPVVAFEDSADSINHAIGVLHEILATLDTKYVPPIGTAIATNPSFGGASVLSSKARGSEGTRSTRNSNNRGSLNSDNTSPAGSFGQRNSHNSDLNVSGTFAKSFVNARKEPLLGRESAI